jgi:hypothetical protein
MGEEGQRKLKATSVLISRVGGLGGLVALELAAAGVGRLVLAHGGDLQPSDLNRQLAANPRSHRQAAHRIHREAAAGAESALRHRRCAGKCQRRPMRMTLVAQADVVVDAAPLFQERLALNAAAFRARKPMVECAMHTLEASVTTFVPGKTGCLSPAMSPQCRRLGSGNFRSLARCLARQPVHRGDGGDQADHRPRRRLWQGELLSMNLATMQFRKVRLPKSDGLPGVRLNHAISRRSRARRPCRAAA